MPQLTAAFSNDSFSRRYSQFQGWLYAAVHALAIEAAQQPVEAVLLRSREQREDPDERRSQFQTKKAIIDRMPDSLRQKAAVVEFDVVPQHPILEYIEHPNPVQTRWEMVYTFVCNLNLTGWAYLVGGETEDGRLEIYSLPTSWVIPIHKNGPFSQFVVGDPNDPATKKGPLLSSDNVKLARFPNPGHPLGAISPSTGISNAINIDQKIQRSQEVFFDRGIFPSVILSVGKEPHPEVPGGLRPRLSNAQRRQVIGSIQKAMSGVERYGDPAIVDGMIEKIERLSATFNEMGWAESEERIRTRILAAFGVHPFIIGEPVDVGGHAQATRIEKRFFKRVNSFLDLLTMTVNRFVDDFSSEESLRVWWEKCDSIDPTIRSTNLRFARSQGDISKNELRAELGFPPDENDQGPRSKILDNPNGMMAVVTMINMISQGKVTQETGAILLSLFLQIPEDVAEEIAARADANTLPIDLDQGPLNQIPAREPAEPPGATIEIEEEAE